ncbi:PTS fructose transporter subunit IIABC [Mesoplasma chauliocola]|uniref:PTS fructose transporter subunit IIABC n=1 Tax=Mesoplasma chauliocola TaxID=216427 RepID=A0A249SMU9_9MOLU|nr:fructose-specific PTS transporter subunit EIIC [Mesoplasma chauliocola]ASZ08938.1 PTS fructose transporter subunit IIABC [Mesoplasma chauliocola]
MELKDLFKSKVSVFQADLKSKQEVINFLVEKLSNEKMIANKKDFKDAILKRESEASTGMGDGIGIPHAINDTVKEPCIAFVSLKSPIDWESFDNKPVDLIFMIATNDEKGEAHLGALADLSKFLMKSEFQEALRKAKSFKALQVAFNNKSEAKRVEAKEGKYDVIGITACPTGIAHTYLAEEKLIEYATELGLSVKIETQGRRGTENKLSQEDVDNAKVIILAHDKNIQGMGRFSGKQIIDTTTKDAIFNGKELIQDFGKNEKTITAKNVSSKDDEAGDDFSLKKFAQVKGNLLAGVSRMLPFVVAGGIILGIGFLIDFAMGNGNPPVMPAEWYTGWLANVWPTHVLNETGNTLTPEQIMSIGSTDWVNAWMGDFGTHSLTAGWFTAIGKTGMMLMVPILAGYISYTIVGPQGLMPGFIAGVFADGLGGVAYGTPGSWSGLWTRLIPVDIPMQSGFIGGMVGAYVAALIVFGLTVAFKKFKKSFHGIRDIVLIPLLSLLGISLAMFALNIPLGYTMYGLQQFLKLLAEHNLLILLGAILGFMMCVDMGGPINKIAYVTGVLSVSGGLGSDPLITLTMAAAMAGGMVPPLGIALCTLIFRKAWTQKEKDSAKANWLMGAFFISEGAIPFMVTDPKRISLSAMAGGTITGLMVGAFKITLGAPHGGIAVFPLLKSGLVDLQSGTAIGLGVGLYILSIVVGTVVMATILGFWKSYDIKKGKLVIVN